MGRLHTLGNDRRLHCQIVYCVQYRLLGVLLWAIDSMLSAASKLSDDANDCLGGIMDRFSPRKSTSSCRWKQPQRLLGRVCYR